MWCMHVWLSRLCWLRSDDAELRCAACSCHVGIDLDRGDDGGGDHQASAMELRNSCFGLDGMRCQATMLDAAALPAPVSMCWMLAADAAPARCDAMRGSGGCC